MHLYIQVFVVLFIILLIIGDINVIRLNLNNGTYSKAIKANGWYLIDIQVLKVSLTYDLLCMIYTRG